MRLDTLIAEPWADYGLVDSGHGRKLERYGRYRFIRPEAQALWAPASADWEADGEFIPGSDEEGGGRWQFARPVPKDGWDLSWEEVWFRAQCTPFRHLAFFPDMAPQWAWMRERLGEGSEALNLFGYTGVGTLAMSATGARLTHVDASKKSVEAGKANAMTAFWAMFFFWMRVTHAVVYLLAIPYVRTAVFTLGFVAVAGLFWEVVK